MNRRREEAHIPHLSPPTLTRAEQRAILRVTAGSPCDHLIYSLARGTGLRLAEIVGMNVGNVYTPEGRPRNRVRLRAEIAKGGGGLATCSCRMPCWPSSRDSGGTRAIRREGLASVDPLFCNQSRRRISKRRVQVAFRTWQVKAGFDRSYPLHALRHTAVTNVYRGSRDLFLAQRFASHMSPLTTTVYTHPSDEELFHRASGLSW